MNNEQNESKPSSIFSQQTNPKSKPTLCVMLMMLPTQTKNQTKRDVVAAHLHLDKRSTSCYLCNIRRLINAADSHAFAAGPFSTVTSAPVHRHVHVPRYCLASSPTNVNPLLHIHMLMQALSAPAYVQLHFSFPLLIRKQWLSSASGGRGGGGRGQGGQQQRALNKFGHDYTQIGGPIDKSVCKLSEAKIHNLIHTRIQSRRNRDYEKANRIQNN